MKDDYNLTHQEIEEPLEKQKPFSLFVKKNWLSILGIVLGVLGLLSSYYFYSLSEQNREPVVLDIHNFSILSPVGGLLSDSFAVVTKPDMKEISKNIYIHEVAFWNKGRLAIKKENVLKKIKFEYPEKVEILDTFIKSSTRPEIINASESHTKGGREISIDFDILEKDDGFKLQVIYASEQRRSPTIQGNIEGVSAIANEQDLAKENLWFGIGKTILVVLFLIAGGAVVMGLVFGFVELASRFLPSYIGWAIFIIFIASFIIYIIFVLYTASAINAKQEGRNSLPEMQSIDSTSPPKTMIKP